MKKSNKRKQESQSKNTTAVKIVPGTSSRLESNKNELETIFESIKNPKKATKNGNQETKVANKRTKVMVKKDKIDKLGFSTVSVGESTRRRTEDNLPIYTMEELNIGKGGDTTLCPFDCDCCF